MEKNGQSETTTAASATTTTATAASDASSKRGRKKKADEDKPAEPAEETKVEAAPAETVAKVDAEESVKAAGDAPTENSATKAEDKSEASADAKQRRGRARK